MRAQPFRPKRPLRFSFGEASTSPMTSEAPSPPEGVSLFWGGFTIAEFPNLYKEERKKSQGEKEVEAGGNLVKLFVIFKIKMPYQADVKAVERVGQLLVRRWPWLARLLGVK